MSRDAYLSQYPYATREAAERIYSENEAEKRKLVDADGFDLLVCTGPCGATKPASLFAPSSVRSNKPSGAVCIACRSAEARRHFTRTIKSAPAKEVWRGLNSTVAVFRRPGRVKSVETLFKEKR